MLSVLTSHQWVGIGIYGLVNIFLNAETKEPIAQTFERMEEKISYQEAFNSAMMELDPVLSEIAWEQKMTALEFEEELQTLKATIEAESQINHGKNSSTSIPNPKLESSYTQQDEASRENHHELQELTVETKLGWKCVQILKEHTASVNCIVISPDNQILASGSDDKTVKLWDLKTGKQLYTFLGQGAEVQTLTISPDGKMLIAGGFDQRITGWYLNNKSLFCSFFGWNSPYSHAGAIYSTRFSPDGKFLFSASGDRTIRVWGGYTGKLQCNLNGHSDIVWSVAISSESQTLASGSADGTIRLWDLGNYQPLRILSGHSGEVICVEISPDGKTLISSSRDSTIRLWDLQTGELLHTLTGHTASVLSLAISPDGEILASASSKEIKLWHLKSRKLLDNLSGSSPVRFSPNGQTLVTGGNRNSIKIWCRTLGREESIFEPLLSGEWWEVLQVKRNTDPDSVKLAYRRLARLYHPDINRSVSAITKMQAVNHAYEQFLANPK